MNRLNESNMMKCGEECFIIIYKNANDITIQFKNTGELVKTSYNSFKKGAVKSHFAPTVYGVGITGLEVTRGENGKHFHSYKCWSSMLQRVYSEKFQINRPTYKDCIVCDEWLYYKNFAEWYDENYYEIEGQRTELDKDILVKGNKIYSPSTCVFVPHIVNSMFTKRQNDRGALPIGIYLNKRNNKYIAQCSTKLGRQVFLGEFKTQQEAFSAYKKYKENSIKEIANEYREQIPQKLYEALLEYEVKIND